MGDVAPRRWSPVVAVLVLVSSVPLFIVVDKNFIPNDDQSEFEVNLRAPEGTSLEATELIDQPHRRRPSGSALPEVDYTVATIGGDPVEDPQPVVGLRPADADSKRGRAISSRSWTSFATRSCRRCAKGLRTSVQPVAAIGGGGAQNADVMFLINGPDLKVLEQISRRLVDEGEDRSTGVVDVDSSLNVGKPELGVQLDRPKAADLGVQIGDAAEALRLLVGGDQVTTYNEGSEQYEVHLRAIAVQPVHRAGDRRADGAVARGSGACRSTTSRRSRRAKRRPTSTGWRGNAR